MAFGRWSSWVLVTSRSLDPEMWPKPLGVGVTVVYLMMFTVHKRSVYNRLQLQWFVRNYQLRYSIWDLGEIIFTSGSSLHLLAFAAFAALFTSHLHGSLARTVICFSIEFAELSYNIRSTSVLWPRLCYKAAARGCWRRVRTPDVKVVSVFGRIQGGLLLNRWCCSCHYGWCCRCWS